MIRPFTFLFVLLLIWTSTSAQKKSTISGYVKDINNGEAAIGATIYIPEIKSGVNTNIYGFYSISLEPGSYTLVFSYIGYGSVTKKIDLKEDVTLTLELKPADVELTEVVIEGEKKNQNECALWIPYVKGV